MLALRVLLSVCLSLEWVVKPGWWLHSLSGHATWVVRPSSIPEPTLLHEAFEFVVATKAITSKSVECVDSFSYSTPLSPSPPHHTRSRPCVEQLISCHNRVCLWATTHESRLPAWLPAWLLSTSIRIVFASTVRWPRGRAELCACLQAISGSSNGFTNGNGNWNYNCLFHY